MAVALKVVDLRYLPPADEFLSEREQAVLAGLKLPKRRKEWLGGRFALKILVCAEKKVPFKQVEILAPQEGGKPVLRVLGQKCALAFSITHSHGYAAAGIAPQDKYLGIDLEKIAPRIDAWKDDFFHPSELTEKGDAFLTALWTQKEAVVKLLGTGLAVNSFDVRCVKGAVSFYGKAAEIYRALGSPVIRLKTERAPEGFAFSIAVGK